MKGYVARHNTTYKLLHVKQLIENAVDEITTDKWSRCVEHVLKEEDKFWKFDQITDAVVGNLIINTADSSDDSSSDTE